jgi:hypothetical protein
MFSCRLGEHINGQKQNWDQKDKLHVGNNTDLGDTAMPSALILIASIAACSRGRATGPRRSAEYRVFLFRKRVSQK